MLKGFLQKSVYGQPAIAPMSERAIDNVRLLEGKRSQLPQVPIQTYHALHAGMYVRTVYVPKGVMITGALVKIPTILISDGHATVYIDCDTMTLRGRQTIQCAAGRKQVFVAHSDFWLSMIFPTKAKTVEEAEAEFTDEGDLLLSRRQT